MEITPQRRLAPARSVAGWIACGALVLAAMLFAVARRPAERSVPVAAWPPAPAQDGSAAPEDAAQAEEDASAFEALLDQYLGEPDAPAAGAARRFASQFMRDPVLHAAFRRYRQQSGPLTPGPAARAFGAFAHDVADRAEFKTLVAHFMQDPVFRSAAQRFVQAPSVRAALGPQTASWSPQSDASPSAFRTAVTARTATPASRSANSALLGAAPAAGAQPSAGPARHGPVAFAAAAGDAELPGSPTDLAAAPDASATAAGNAAQAPPPQAPQQDGAPVTPLANAPVVGGDVSLTVQSLCFRRDPAITEQQCSAINQYLTQYGLWGACYKAGQFDLCKNLCLTRPELHCKTSVPDFMSTCLKIDSAATCAAACAKDPACTGGGYQPPSGPCPYGNGLYCGGDSIAGNPTTLYNCSNGQYTVVNQCANGCHYNPAHVNDVCN